MNGIKRFLPFSFDFASLFYLLLFFLPYYLITRSRENLADYGLTLVNWKRDIGIVLLTSLLIFPVYSIGFYFWQKQIVQKEFHWEISKLKAWDVSLAGKPRGKRPVGQIWLWEKASEIYIQWDQKYQHLPYILKIKKGGLKTVKNRRYQKVTPEGIEILPKRNPPVQWTSLSLNQSQRLVFEFNPSIPLHQIHLGENRIVPKTSHFQSTLGFEWLFYLVLTQIFIIGLAEEFFYRGYMQTRINRIISNFHYIKGIPIGWLSIIITSALFALGHFLVDVNFLRLAVFFPSLLFGVLRQWSGTIVAPMIFHGLCNIYVAIASKLFY